MISYGLLPKMYETFFSRRQNIGLFSELRRRLYLPEKNRYCQKRDVTPRLLRLSVFLFHVFYCRKRRAIKFLENGVRKHVLSKIHVFTFF